VLVLLPVLCDVIRSGFVESRHRGSVVVLGGEGEPVRVVGDAGQPVFSRSSMKPLQAVAMLRCGLALPSDQLALACASHDGEDLHAELCVVMLEGAGLSEDDLACPRALPEPGPKQEAFLRAGRAAGRARHNCSGKHAAMLATCVLRGWPTGGYLAPEHPLQLEIRREIEELAGEPVTAVGVDGCGAPQFAFSLTGLARGFRRIAAAAAGSRERAVADAMRAHPVLVGGSGRDVTELMECVPGLIAKDGAEGVYAAALDDGRAMAVKVDDGGMRAVAPVLVEVLRAWGHAGDALDRWATTPVEGGGRVVGRVQARAMGLVTA
jgi:L-asparaginase II